MKIVDPVTGVEVEIDSTGGDTSITASNDSDGTESQVLEAPLTGKEVLYHKLNEVQAGRPISDIPLKDAYWDVRAELQHFTE